MLVKIKLLNGFKETLFYNVPEELAHSNLLGKIVKIPLKNQSTEGLIVEYANQNEKIDFKIKSIQSLAPFPSDTNFDQFVNKVSNYYLLNKFYFYQRIYQTLSDKEIKKIEDTEIPAKIADVKLSAEQEAIFQEIVPNIANGKYFPTILYGVTGSGKTEIYKELIKCAISNNKSVIFLHPEITLSIQFFNLLRNSLSPEIEIFSFHSSVSKKEKRLLWQKLIENKPVVILGVHMPIFLPISNLGLILIDEEHDCGYQEKKHPRINTKEAALLRAQTYNIPIVMGSATPSIVSLFNVESKNYNLYQLTQRFSGKFPEIKIIKLGDAARRKNFWISNELIEAIKDRLEKKEQVIIYLNRRGFSFFVQCKKCGFINNCPNCSVSLTLHENNQLICHYCDFKEILESKCKACPALEKDLLKKGLGTQQIVKILQEAFPNANIARADLDSTRMKKNWQNIVDNFRAGQIDILVGTQTITKGYDFENVTLVGIIWADINLSIPQYNSAEISLQQLLQVAGRSGRHKKNGLVIVQTIADHEIYKFVNEIDYMNFYKTELEHRQLVGYPPAMRIALLELKFDNEDKLTIEAKKLFNFLDSEIKKNNLGIRLLGPSKPMVWKIQGRFAKLIYLKSKQLNQILKLANSIDRTKFESKIYFVQNPLN